MEAPLRAMLLALLLAVALVGCAAAGNEAPADRGQEANTQGYYGQRYGDDYHGRRHEADPDYRYYNSYYEDCPGAGEPCEKHGHCCDGLYCAEPLTRNVIGGAPPRAICYKPCPAVPTLSRPANTNAWVCSGTSFGATCTASCSGSGNPAVASCSAQGTWVLTSAGTCTDNSCFTGDSKVVVRRSPEPIAMRDLQIGDDVLCVAAPDLLTPGAARFCEVRSFVRADEQPFGDMARLDWTIEGSDIRGSTTLALSHMVHVLTDEQAPRAQPASTVDALGAFDLIAVKHAMPGQRIPVVAPGGRGFVAAVIEAAERVTSLGKYTPALEEPYIVVDGVVAPLWSAWPELHQFVDAAQPEARYGAHRLANAFRHIAFSPMWMTTTHAKGTPGRDVSWDGAPRPPLSSALTASFGTNKTLDGVAIGKVSGAANFTAAFEWFAPRLAAWRADPEAGAVTVTEALAAWPTTFAPQRAPAVAAVVAAPGFETAGEVFTVTGLCNGAASGAQA